MKALPLPITGGEQKCSTFGWAKGDHEQWKNGNKAKREKTEKKDQGETSAKKKK